MQSGEKKSKNETILQLQNTIPSKLDLEIWQLQLQLLQLSVSAPDESAAAAV